jgi:hypothetical protein
MPTSRSYLTCSLGLHLHRPHLPGSDAASVLVDHWPITSIGYTGGNGLPCRKAARSASATNHGRHRNQGRRLPSNLAAIGRQTPTVVVARAAMAEGIDVVRTYDVTGASSPPTISSSSATAESSTSTAGAHPVPRNGDAATMQRCAPAVWDGWPASSPAA